MSLDPYIRRALDRDRPFPLIEMGPLEMHTERTDDGWLTTVSAEARVRPGVVMVGPVAIPRMAYNQAVYHNGRFLGTIEAMAEFPTPFIDTEAEQPDSEELAAKYEARALQMEQDAADAQSPAQQIGNRLGAGAMRRKAAEIRARLEK